MKNQFRVLSFSLVAVAMIASTPVWADSLLVQSDLSNTQAQVAGGDAGLSTFNASEIAGLTFSSVQQDWSDGSGAPWAYVPNAPAGTIKVNFPDSSNAYNQPSGFVETTFVLPENFTAASINGEFSVDDQGVVFLNGHNIGAVGPATYASFATTVQSDFVAGTNTLIISDNNSGGGPSGVEFYGNVNYAAPQTNVTPEPSSMLLMGSGLLGFAGMVRRKIAARA